MLAVFLHILSATSSTVARTVYIITICISVSVFVATGAVCFTGIYGSSFSSTTSTYVAR